MVSEVLSLETVPWHKVLYKYVPLLTQEYQWVRRVGEGELGTRWLFCSGEYKYSEMLHASGLAGVASNHRLSPLLGFNYHK